MSSAALAGVSVGPEEGLSHQQHQHEAVRQPHAHADGRQAQVQAPVQEGGVGHAAVLAVLHLPPWGQGHVRPAPAPHSPTSPLRLCLSFSYSSLDDSSSFNLNAPPLAQSLRKAFVVAWAAGRWRVTLVNPSGNDVGHTQTNSITPVQMSPQAGGAPNIKRGGGMKDWGRRGRRVLWGTTRNGSCEGLKTRRRKSFWGRSDQSNRLSLHVPPPSAAQPYSRYLWFLYPPTPLLRRTIRASLPKN